MLSLIMRVSFIWNFYLSAFALVCTECNFQDIGCQSNHCNFVLILQSAFNCFTKNRLKCFNSVPSLENLQVKSPRKVLKLTSKASFLIAFLAIILLSRLVKLWVATPKGVA